MHTTLRSGETDGRTYRRTDKPNAISPSPTKLGEGIIIYPVFHCSYLGLHEMCLYFQ